jgi:hypothetical protein
MAARRKEDTLYKKEIKVPKTKQAIQIPWSLIWESV